MSRLGCLAAADLLDVDRGTWVTVKEASNDGPGYNLYAGAWLVWGDNLLLIGGRTASDAYKTVWFMHIPTLTWSLQQDLEMPYGLAPSGRRVCAVVEMMCDSGDVHTTPSLLPRRPHSGSLSCVCTHRGPSPRWAQLPGLYQNETASLVVCFGGRDANWGGVSRCCAARVVVSV